jgi:hypothetical protein
MRRASVPALAACLFAACAAWAQTHLDGPYVIGDAQQIPQAVWVERTADGGARQRAQPVGPGASITVAAVGDLPAFTVKLRGAAAVAPDTVAAPAKAKLFVVADTHGEYEILARMLVTHRIVDERLAWAFGRGHLVVLGDVLDRGPHHTEILWLLYELEAQARRAGGGVHLVLGNHEAMVLSGDLRYLHPKYPQTAAALGVRSYAQLFDARSVLGQWLRSRPAVLRIGRRAYLHGGISRALVDRGYTLADVNGGVRAALAGAPPADPAVRERVEFLLGPLGPLWYRGYFAGHTDFPTASAADVDAVLKHFAVDTVLIGHTIVPTITPLYGGKVIAVQVYPKREHGARASFEALRIDGGRFERATFDGRVEPLPMPTVH